MSFLPPEPPGPEPELGRPLPQPQPPPPPQPQPQAQPYHAQAAEPDNGPAIAGFVLSVVAVGLLLFSGGLSSIVSVVCAALGIWYSRRGKRRIELGETRRHRGLAQAGFVIGIVSLVLALLATAVWVLILVLALTDEAFQDDLERELDDSNTIAAALRIGAAAARLLG